MYGPAESGPRPSWSGHLPITARRAGLTCGGKGGRDRGDVTSPPGVPPGPRAILWRILSVHVCKGVSAPTGVGPRYHRHGVASGCVGTHEARGSLAIGASFAYLALRTACGRRVRSSLLGRMRRRWYPADSSDLAPGRSSWRGHIYSVTPPALAGSRLAAHALPGPGRRLGRLMSGSPGAEPPTVAHTARDVDCAAQEPASGLSPPLSLTGPRGRAAHSVTSSLPNSE